MSKKYILTLSCPDRMGIVAKVSSFLADENCNIHESAQFNDENSCKFFMRVVYSGSIDLSRKFEEIAQEFEMDWQIADADKKPKVLILVSKSSHCLNHLLHRNRVGSLDIEIAAVASNHNDLAEMAQWHKIPFHHIPMPNEDKIEQLVEELEIDLVILARYMQILSPALSKKLTGKAINIHHSFLPSFKGANPYKQAFEKGVKIIGATAHYVTDDLDEGPIIEQEVIRVDHTQTAKELKIAGADIENLVLAKAVKYHIEHRTILNGNKTVVFK